VAVGPSLRPNYRDTPGRTAGILSSSSRMNDSSGVGIPIAARDRHVMAPSNNTFSTNAACFTSPSSVIREGAGERRV
jgi:hypothetical protein